MIRTDTTKLEKLYSDLYQAKKQEYAGQKAELDAQKKEVARDTKSALQQAYINKIRGDYSVGQANRAAGITGGMAINNSIARDNAYSGTHTDLLLNRQTKLDSLNNQGKILNAQQEQFRQQNMMNLDSEKRSIAIQDRNMRNDLWSKMLDGNYLPSDTVQLNQMAADLAITPQQLRAWIAYKKKN